MGLRKLLLILLLGGAVWLGFDVTYAGNIKRKVLSLPANALTHCEKPDSPEIDRSVLMSVRDCATRIFTKNESSTIRRFFLTRDLAWIWMSLYVLAGLTGALAFFLLMWLLGLEKAFLQWGKIVVRLLVAGVAGLVCYLGIKALEPLLLSYFSVTTTTENPSFTTDTITASLDAFYDKLEVVPLLAGMFPVEFFRQARQSFRDALRGLLEQARPKGQGEGGNGG